MIANKQTTMVAESSPWSLERKVVADKRLLSSEVRGEAVILNVQSGTYYGLDEVGTRIWQLVQQPISLGDVLTTLLSEYDVEAHRCERDLCRYIDDLADKGLISCEG